MAGWGMRLRSLPTGGAAKGMPFQLMTPSFATPRTVPDSVFITVKSGPCACTLATNKNAKETEDMTLRRTGFISYPAANWSDNFSERKANSE